MSRWKESSRERRTSRQCKDPSEIPKHRKKRGTTKSEKPFCVERRAIDPSYALFESDIEWHTWSKYATDELAQRALRKAQREFMARIYEFRVIEKRTTTE